MKEDGRSYKSLSYLGLGVKREEIAVKKQSHLKGSTEKGMLLWVQHMLHKKSERKANLKARLHIFSLS